MLRIRRRCPALALALTLAPPLASAQTAQPTAPEASPEVLEATRRIFREGVDAAEQGRWEDARQRFARAAALRDAPLIRFNLAVACRNVGRLGEAIENYRRFMQATPEASDPARTEAARREVSQLAARMATLRVVVTGDPPRRFSLDGRDQPVALLAEDIPVDPGPHTVDVEGSAGDHQRREGALYEAERMRVEIELSPLPAQRAGAAVIPRAQSFGHWVARPGPGGRWVDWASRDAPAPRSPWERRPLTLALQVGAGTPSGTLSADVRYFPVPWVGGEVAGGIGGAWGAGLATLAHVRAVTGQNAIGVFGGLGYNAVSASIDCRTGVQCDGGRTKRSLGTLSLHLGAQYERRLSERFSLRVVMGVRFVTNRASLREQVDPGLYDVDDCSVDGPLYQGRGGPCGAAAVPEGQSLAPAFFIGLDLGFSP